MKRRASRLRKGQASLERHCHISGIPITLSTPPPATTIKGSSGERTGRIKFLMYTCEISQPIPTINHLQEIKTDLASIFQVQEKCL